MMRYTFYHNGSYITIYACTALAAFTQLEADYGHVVWDEATLTTVTRTWTEKVS